MDTCHGNYRGSRSRLEIKAAARRHAKLLQGSACDSGKARGCVDMACRIILGRSKVERGSFHDDGFQLYVRGELQG